MYGFSIQLKDTFENALRRVNKVLSSEGFGLLTEIDAQAALKAKLGVKMRPYRILGAYSPLLAHQALRTDPDIGVLLPCNVVVREEAAGKVIVAFMDPAVVMSLGERREISKLGMKVRRRLERCCGRLK